MWTGCSFSTPGSAVPSRKPCSPPSSGSTCRPRPIRPPARSCFPTCHNTVVLPDDTTTRCRPPAAGSHRVTPTRKPPAPRGATTPRPGAVPLPRGAIESHLRESLRPPLGATTPRPGAVPLPRGAIESHLRESLRPPLGATTPRPGAVPPLRRAIESHLRESLRPPLGATTPRPRSLHSLGCPLTRPARPPVPVSLGCT